MQDMKMQDMEMQDMKMQDMKMQDMKMKDMKMQESNIIIVRLRFALDNFWTISGANIQTVVQEIYKQLLHAPLVLNHHHRWCVVKKCRTTDLAMQCWILSNNNIRETERWLDDLRVKCQNPRPSESLLRSCGASSAENKLNLRAPLTFYFDTATQSGGSRLHCIVGWLHCSSSYISHCSLVIGQSHVSPFLIIGMLLAVSGWMNDVSGDVVQPLASCVWLARCGQPWICQRINQSRVLQRPEARGDVRHVGAVTACNAYSCITCILSQVYWHTRNVRLFKSLLCELCTVFVRLIIWFSRTFLTADYFWHSHVFTVLL